VAPRFEKPAAPHQSNQVLALTTASFTVQVGQGNANVPSSVNPGGKRGRGVPDVTGDGDNASGYAIYFDGSGAVVGGTSAVAPLWAALIARINQKLGGRVGFINPQIYALAPNSGAFNDIVVGDNKCSYQNFNNVGYTAGPGWDACSGHDISALPVVDDNDTVVGIISEADLVHRDSARRMAPHWQIC
jgi:CBS domain-containing protein